MKKSYLNKTMLSSSYSFHKLEEDGQTDFVVIISMTFKDGTLEHEIVENITEKEYFQYKLGKKYDPYKKYRKENGS